MGVRIQELPETTGINKEDLLIVEDGQGTKKGTVQQLDEALGVSQLKEDLGDYAYRFKENEISLTFERGGYYADPITGKFDDLKMLRTKTPITSHASLDSFYKMYSLDGNDYYKRY